jgi:Bacterial mobilisation protein (MobC)
MTPHDNPPPASPHGEPSGHAAPRSPNRGSEKRQRGVPVSVRLLPGERAAVEEKAREVGLSIAGFLRACALGTPGPRAKRSPSVNAEALGRATAALNKVGSNLNQIAHHLNAGGAISTAHECFAALAETRAAAAAIRQTVGRKDRP